MGGASCLKSPRIQAKPKPKPNQNLSEASGKGAELYARRQSRMEKYVIESSGHAELARCPSPTMSLPSSWKYSTNAPGGTFRVASRSPARRVKEKEVGQSLGNDGSVAKSRT